MRGYESPRPQIWVRWCQLFLPMRGYEVAYVFAVGTADLVISPHEGLWDIWYVSISHYLGTLFLPMRGYESWSLPNSPRRIQCYFSPWGVMRGRGGYSPGNSSGYFSPWGVMRLGFSFMPLVSWKLFLPMRGYEAEGGFNLGQIFMLFLPMRGYEVLQIFHFPKYWRLFLPMRGYEPLPFPWMFCPNPVLFLPMRGYEQHPGMQKNQQGNCYFSPWGVMRLKWHRQFELLSGYFSPWGVMSQKSIGRI